MNAYPYVDLEDLEELPVAEVVDAPSSLETSDVIDLLLKDQCRLDEALRDETNQRVLIPKLLGIAMAGFAIYGVVATVILNLAHRSGFWLPHVPTAFWNDASAANLTLAYCLGLIAANGICLPSFYFYSLLAGVRISMVGIVAHLSKGMAIGAIVLVGVLPVYVALTLCAVTYVSDPNFLALVMLVALALPFLAGTWGAVCLHRGFMGLCDTMRDVDRADRLCMLRRLIFAWCGCYTFVTPLVIYSLWMNLEKVVMRIGSI